ncbi:hypothetical protein O59_002876 [Cellvibrio sp. BR]|nr:hypothetical protein O59_002876 [Cellvibrio sp. BR]
MKQLQCPFPCGYFGSRFFLPAAAVFILQKQKVFNCFYVTCHI